MPSMKTNPIIKATDIFKAFGQLKVLKGVSINLYRGEVIAIIGPSGSGKSTFLRCLNHLETIDTGRIEIEGRVLVDTDEQKKPRYAPEKEIRTICTPMGMVFQQFNLFPHMTVLQNLIEAPITVKRKKQAEIIPLAETLLDKVGLLEKRDRYPSQLSGGQKQRVAIARALTMEPDIMLFDEPTSALDPELTGEVLQSMKQLAKERMTMMIVTHEMAFAREVADTVYFMDKGIIIESGDAKTFFDKPTHARTQEFLSKML